MFITLFNLFSRLKKAYWNHATCLIQTGSGLRPETEADDENAHHEYSNCYIPTTGPNGGTTERAKNIWGVSRLFHIKFLRSDKQTLEKIIGEYPYFGELHRLFYTHPNFNPPAIMTGTGPQGRRTVHYQAPGQTQTQWAVIPVIDPALMDLTYPPCSLAPLGASNAFNVPDMAVEHDLVEPTAPVPCGVENKENPQIVSRAPKASSFGSVKLGDAVKKAYLNVKPLRTKCQSGLEDVFTEMSRCVFYLFIYFISYHC
jgi:hypothetical protein